MSEERSLKILVVDDESHMRDLISRWLEAEGYSCRTAANAEEAWESIQKDEPALVVSDLKMPGKSGMELLKIIRERCPTMAVIMVTAVDDRETAIRALQMGAYAYVIKPFSENELHINVANAMQRREMTRAYKVYQRHLEAEVQKRTAEIRRLQEEIVMRLLSVAESRDEATGQHVKRIGLFSAILAEALGWETAQVEDIRLAAMMHDVGKIAIPDGILLKAGRLTPEEWDIVKKHSEIGARILGDSDVPLMQMAGEIALYHHEKWDGTGYPRGLAGEQIPECARIVTIADVYDALSQPRVYRAPFSEEEAVGIMIEEGGKHFDPRIFDRFLEVVPEFRRIRAESVNSG